MNLRAFLVVALVVVLFTVVPRVATHANQNVVSASEQDLVWLDENHLVDSLADALSPTPPIDVSLIESTSEVDLDSASESAMEEESNNQLETNEFDQAIDLIELTSEGPVRPGPGRSPLVIKPPPTSAAAVLTDAVHEAKWEAFKKANPQKAKSYLTPKEEGKAYQTFMTNRAKILAANNAVATALNPKPFSSAGPFADMPKDQFQKIHLRKTRRPTSSSIKKQRFAQVQGTLEMEVDVEKPGRTATSAGTKAGSAGKKGGSAGTKAGSAGAQAGSAGTKAGSAGAQAGSSGTKAGSSGTKAGSSGTKAGSSGTKAGSSGTKAGSSGTKAGSSGTKAGSDGTSSGSAAESAPIVYRPGMFRPGHVAGRVEPTKVEDSATDGSNESSESESSEDGSGSSGLPIVSPTAANLALAKKFQPYTGSVFNHPEDVDVASRVCRVISMVWFARFAATPEQILEQFGDFVLYKVGDTEVKTNNGAQNAQNPRLLCRNNILSPMQRQFDLHYPKRAWIRNAFAELLERPTNSPFMNDYVATSDQVYDQQLCGSCYAQAAIGSLEVALKKAGRYTGPLSVQQAIDCVKTADSQGCAGGTPMDVIDYFKTVAPAQLAKDYPYTGVTGTCRAQPQPFQKGGDTSLAYSTGWSFVGNNETDYKPCTSGDCSTQFKYEIDILQGVKSFGPYIAYVDASNWQHYASGIYPPQKCSPTSDAGNHVVQLLGYGHENGIPYWIIKNSWGTEWGEKGFIRLAMGINSCGIANWIMKADVTGV